jgi:hypothetical protein
MTVRLQICPTELCLCLSARGCPPPYSYSYSYSTFYSNFYSNFYYLFKLALCSL